MIEKGKCSLHDQDIEKAILKGKKLESIDDRDWKELEANVVAITLLCLADDVMYPIMDEESPSAIWFNIENSQMSKSLTNKLYLK